MAEEYKWASLTIDMPDGTKKRIRFTGKTQKEANKKRDKAKMEYDAGILIVNNKTTVARWYTEWIETYKKPKVQASTVKDIESIFNRFFLPDLGSIKLHDLRKFHLQQSLNKLTGYSENYIRRCYVYLVELIRDAPEGSMQYDATRGLDKPKGKKTIPRRAMTEQERKLFKEAIEKHHMGAFFGIMYACDLRPQEARALSIFNVNFKDRTIKINQAVEAGTEKEVKSPKTDDGYRTIIVPDWYMPLLKRAYDKATEMGSPYLFPNTKGGIIGHKTLYRTWGSLMREMDLLAGAKTYRNKIIVHAIAQDLTPYNLRHTCCTEFAENGVDLKMAQYLMGHSDISITAKIYTHVTDKMTETARQKINNGN